MKPLSELLSEVEPDFLTLTPKFKGDKFVGYNQVGGSHFYDTYEMTYNFVDRASYDKLKAIAVELAKACEFYGNSSNWEPSSGFTINVKDGIVEKDIEGFDIKSKCPVGVGGKLARENINTAREMLEGK